MKKYIALFGFTLMIIGGLYWYQKEAASVTMVEATQISSILAQDVVNCSGRIEEAEKKEIYTEFPVVATKVFVAEGDSVEKGALLFEISPSKTVEALATYYSNLASGGDIQSVMGILQNEEILSYLNENGIDLNQSKQEFLEKIPQKIYAPDAGIVTSINLTKGVLTNQEQPIAVISSTEQLQLRLSVNEANISDVKTGQKVTITGSGFKDKEYHGTVQSISSVAKQVMNGTATETAVEVIVSIDDADQQMKAGFSANAKIVVEETPDALIVPYECVRGEDDASEYVYVWRDSQVKKVLIKPEKEMENGFLISSGSIQDGDILFLNPDLVERSGRVMPQLEQDGGNENV